MILYSESAMDINAKQVELALNIAAHDIYSMTDMYVESCYMEDASATKNESSEKKTVFNTIIENIITVIFKM